MRADGVFSGGGIKGLTFAGAVQAAAEAGYDEWVQLAGTSAGAITAMMLAVGYDAQGLRKALETFDFSKIADYGPLGEAEIPINVERLHGATHGKVLSGWITKLLADAPRPATKFGDLDAESCASSVPTSRTRGWWCSPTTSGSTSTTRGSR